MTTDDRIEELTHKLLDDELSADEACELEQALADDEAARAVHIALVQQEAAMRGLLRAVDVEGVVMDRLRQATAQSTTAAVMEQIRGAAPRLREPNWLHWISGRKTRRLAAAAAMLALGVVVLQTIRVTTRRASPQEAVLVGQSTLLPGVAALQHLFVQNALTSSKLLAPPIRTYWLSAICAPRSKPIQRSS